jgi:hypothetical protein
MDKRRSVKKKNTSYDLVLETELYETWQALVKEFNVPDVRHVNKLPLAAKQSPLFKKYLKLRVQFFDKHKKLLSTEAAKQQRGNLDLYEYTVQELALQLAIDLNNYNPYNGVTVASFFTMHFHGARVRAFYQHTYALRPVLSFIQIKNKINKYKTKYNVTFEQACEALNIDTKTGKEAFTAKYSANSLTDFNSDSLSEDKYFEPFDADKWIAKVIWSDAFTDEQKNLLLDAIEENKVNQSLLLKLKRV